MKDQLVPYMCASTEHCRADAVSQRRGNDDTFDITSVLEKTLLGLKARPEFQQELRVSHEPVGKLIRPLRPEEVAERNGERGRPFWIALGQDVFDITGASSLNTCVHPPYCLDY